MAQKVVVLMIEDDAATAESCLKTIRDRVPEVHVEVEHNFGNADAKIKALSPDIIVLDLYEGDPVAEGSAKGLPIWTQIWQGKFCPLIFHTAREFPDDPPPPKDHPFVQYVRKRAKSDLVVANHLKSFLPHVNALRSVQQEIAGVLQPVLRDVAAIIWRAQSDEKERDRTLVRAARRRAAAMMDEATLLDGKPMTNWEQYLIPALGQNPLMGDLLRVVTGQSDDPHSYRVVLTPSCDMVKGRKRCATQILVAKCRPISDYMTAANLSNINEKKMRERLAVLLTQEECGGYVALPALPGVFPVMAAGMRDLDFVQMSTVANAASEGIQYVRIASVDSPFREKLAWTYLQIAARPGMPDCDSEEFITAIIKAISAGTGTKNV